MQTSARPLSLGFPPKMLEGLSDMESSFFVLDLLEGRLEVVGCRPVT